MDATLQQILGLLYDKDAKVAEMAQQVADLRALAEKQGGAIAGYERQVAELKDALAQTQVVKKLPPE